MVVKDEKNILFMDDDPKRANKFMQEHQECTWTTTASGCIGLLPQRQWEEIHLDHDLGGRIYVDPAEKDTGSEVVRHILANYTPETLTARFIVHSYNLPAASAMVRDLKTAGFDAVHIPFDVDMTKSIYML